MTLVSLGRLTLIPQTTPSSRLEELALRHPFSVRECYHLLKGSLRLTLIWRAQKYLHQNATNLQIALPKVITAWSSNTQCHADKKET